MGYILYEKRGYTGIITMNRPEALNALNSDVLAELDELLSKLEADDSLRCVIVTGSGKAFVAGADIAQMQNMNADEAYAFANLGDRVFTRLARLEVPVIAAVNGFALGGGLELALACDIRLASEKAKFGQPEVGLGITPGFGGTQRLSRAVGMSKAMELIFTCDMIKADEAKAIGLVSCVCAPEELMDKALQMAEKIAKNAPVAVKEAKKSVRQFWCADIYTDLEFEAGAFSRCFNTNDQKMGMKAFVEKTEHDEYKGN